MQWSGVDTVRTEQLLELEGWPMPSTERVQTPDGEELGASVFDCSVATQCWLEAQGTVQ
jgi:hypothetical protein